MPSVNARKSSAIAELLSRRRVTGAGASLVTEVLGALSVPDRRRVLAGIESESVTLRVVLVLGVSSAITAALVKPDGRSLPLVTMKASYPTDGREALR